MVKDSCLEEVGVCVLDGRLGKLTPGARARNLFDCIRSSREIGYFFGFLDSTGEVDEEEDEGSLDGFWSNISSRLNDTSSLRKYSCCSFRNKGFRSLITGFLENGRSESGPYLSQIIPSDFVV
ncbi:hypothetical protein ACH5RR_032100 [Cinchona calisaya]|uniref:Uncharacterized protein n=1 Tax=Cinchona calisaya TaxID=153742 RepID=A0ABD2YMF0_9GENT